MTTSRDDLGRAVQIGILEPGRSLRPADKYDAPLLAAHRGPVQFHVMAKPAGSTCNLDCTYCFYLGKETLPGGPGPGRMSEETLESFVRQYVEGVSAPEVTFTWQGGEPMLRGLAFYRKAVALQKQYARPGQTVQNDLQTNGTLLDEEWCAFLEESRFLVGLSIDGPRELHDRYRVNKGGRPTFDAVMKAVKLLQRFGVPFTTLTCVHRQNARRPVDVYRFLRDEVGSTTLQFTPVVEHRGFDRGPLRSQLPAEPPIVGAAEARPGSPGSVVTEWSVDPDDWGGFLCRTFDRWAARDVGRIFVNQFETLVAQHLGLPSQMCVYSETCGKAVAVEHDGSLYACDHFVYPDYRIDDLRSGRLRSAVLAREQVKFGYAKSETLPQACQKCPFLTDCRGECPKNRLLRTAEGEPGLSYLCSGLKTFYAHALPRIESIVADIRRSPSRKEGWT